MMFNAAAENATRFPRFLPSAAARHGLLSEGFKSRSDWRTETSGLDSRPCHPLTRQLAGSFWQIHGFSVRCMSIGVGPGFFASKHLVWIGESFRSHETFERSQPVFVVRGPIVRVATIGRGLEFIGEHARPLFPGEVALSGKAHSQGKRLGLPGLSKDGTALVARERGQRSEPVGFGLQFRHDRGNYPTDRCKQNRAARRPHPTTRARQNEPNTSAAVARQ